MAMARSEIKTSTPRKAGGPGTDPSMRRVLVVDDEQAIREMLADVLCERGLQAVLAGGLNEASTALRGGAFDAVIVDVRLGKNGESGLDLLPLVNETQPHTQSIVISGVAQREDILAALKAGAYDMLGKPFNIAEIEKAVMNAIEKKMLAEENERLVEQLRRERDNLEKRVEAATQDLASKVATLHALNQQISVIFEMTRARGMEGPPQNILEHIIGLLGKIVAFHGAYCVVFDSRAKDFNLVYTFGDSAAAMCDCAKTMLASRHDELLQCMEGPAGAQKDILLKKAMVEAMSAGGETLGKSLVAPLYVPQTFLGVFGLVDISQPTNLTEAEERMIGFALSHFIAAIEERSFLNRTTQLASFGELITEIAHDLRHPMTSMRGAAKILSERWSEDGPRERCLQQMRTDLTRMESLTSELVNFYKPRDMNMTAVDLHDLLDKALEVSHFVLEQRNVQIVRRYEACPATILGLQRNLIEAFVNLITNAIQAMESGGTIKLVTGTDISADKQNWLRQSGRNPDQYLWVSIADTGGGIPKEDLDKIWQRFYTTKSQGTGLGLSAVNRIVRKNLGTIDVASEEGKGATFTVYLPRG